MLDGKSSPKTQNSSSQVSQQIVSHDEPDGYPKSDPIRYSFFGEIGKILHSKDFWAPHPVFGGQNLANKRFNRKIFITSNLDAEAKAVEFDRYLQLI